MATPFTTPNPEPAPATTIGELRRQYGSHFAAGYGDTDTLGRVLGNAGVSTLADYLKQHEQSRQRS